MMVTCRFIRPLPKISNKATNSQGQIMRQKLYLLPNGDVVNLPMITSMKVFKQCPYTGQKSCLQINTITGDFLVTCADFDLVCECRDEILRAVEEMNLENSWE